MAKFKQIWASSRRRAFARSGVLVVALGQLLLATAGRLRAEESAPSAFRRVARRQAAAADASRHEASAPRRAFVDAPMPESDEVQLARAEEYVEQDAAPRDELVETAAYCDALGCGTAVCEEPVWDDCCCGGDVGCGSGCSRPVGIWFRADALAWWVSGMDAPPLVSTSPDGTARANAGVIGQDTHVLFGGNLIDGPILGGRIAAGFDMNQTGDMQFQMTYLRLGSHAEGITQSSNGTPIIARPFLNVETGLEASALVAFPNFVSGTITATAATELQSWDAVVAHQLQRNAWGGVDFLWGYRGGTLEESIYVVESTTSLDANSGAPVGTTINLFDRFATINDFHGGTIGTALNRKSGRWSADLLMKLSIGANRASVTVSGQTVTAEPNQAPTTTTAGLLALPTNIGTRSDTSFAMLPEITLNLQYRMNATWSARAGYTLHYWSNVLRPGGEIDRNLNLSQLPPGPLAGAPFPMVQLDETDFLAHGVSLGLEAVY